MKSRRHIAFPRTENCVRLQRQLQQEFAIRGMTRHQAASEFRKRLNVARTKNKLSAAGSLLAARPRGFT